MTTLHVTNGDFAAHGLRRSGLAGDVLAWRDVLHDGPVPSDQDRAAFRTVRAQFLAYHGWTTPAAAINEFLERDDQLDATSRDDDIVLWFEPDLYDQLQLIQVLSRLQQRAPAQRPAPTIVPADLMLGPLSPEQFPPLYGARRPIDADTLARGHAAWQAFTASEPDALATIVVTFDHDITARSYADDPDVQLPHLTSALRRMLEEYPDAESGLSRTERQILEVLEEGPLPMGQLYRAAHGPREAWTWLGDSSFASYVQRLSAAPVPLVCRADGEALRLLMPAQDATEVWAQVIALTTIGEDVLHARADAVATNGIDRWIGGVHLVSARHWRWNRGRQQLESVKH